MVQEPRPEDSRPDEEEEPLLHTTSRTFLLEKDLTSASPEQQEPLSLGLQGEEPTSQSISASWLGKIVTRVSSQPQAEEPTSQSISAPWFGTIVTRVPSQSEAEEPTSPGISDSWFGKIIKRDPSQQTLGASWPSTTPPPTPRWACGQQRRQLRDNFNSIEMGTLQILKTYDFDNSGTLDMKELKLLLQDYSDQGKPVSDDEVSFVMMVAKKNPDHKNDQQDIVFGLRAWHAWNHMPMSVCAAFTRHQIGQGLPLPSMQALQELMSTLNEPQPVDMVEVDYVRSLAVGLGATTEHATPDQMRKAIAAWYLNIERAETASTTAPREDSEQVGDLQPPTDSFAATKASLCDIFKVSCPQEVLVEEGVDAQLEEAWPSVGESQKSDDDNVKKRFQSVALVSVLACLLLPYVIFVVVVLVKVMMDKNVGNCERNLKAPLAGWVVTEFVSWGFAVFCAYVENGATFKKCSASAIGSARFFILVIGVVGTTHANRKNCNADLYDASMFLFVYIPPVIFTTLLCAPLLGGCCVLFYSPCPSLHQPQQHQPARQFDLCPVQRVDGESCNSNQLRLYVA